MQYRLIAFDLDGTALTSERKITPRLAAACQAAEKKGVTVVIASGRIYRSTKKFAAMLGTHGPHLNCQGAVICDDAGNTLYSRPLTQEMLEDAVTFLRTREHYAQANTNSSFFYEDDTSWSAHYAFMQGFDGEKVRDLTRDLPELPAKVVGMAEPEITLKRFAEAKEIFGDRMEIAVSVPTMLEFTHPEANKGNAIRWLGEHFGIAQEEMIAVGDSFNDLSMIRFAGLGAVMANGREEVKKEADLIVPSNDEDGVAWLIENYILK